MLPYPPFNQKGNIENEGNKKHALIGWGVERDSFIFSVR